MKNDFKQYLKDLSKSKTTIEAYHYHVLNFISFLDRDNTETENCTEKEIMLYLNELNKKELSQQTKKLRLYPIKHYFDYLIENKKITTNPARRIKLKAKQQQKIYPVLKPEELQALHTNYQTPTDRDPKSHHNWFKTYQLSRGRNKIIISLLVNQGITTAEVGRIRLEDLDLRKGTIDIRGGKILRDRTLELKSHQIIDLMEYQYQTRNKILAYHKEPTDQLFISLPTSSQKNAGNSQKFDIFKKLAQELKVLEPKFIKIQQIRNSVITHWLKQYNLRQVQYRAGHKNIYSTEMYLINDIEDLQTEIDNFHPLG